MLCPFSHSDLHWKDSSSHLHHLQRSKETLEKQEILLLLYSIELSFLFHSTLNGVGPFFKTKLHSFLHQCNFMKSVELQLWETAITHKNVLHFRWLCPKKQPKVLFPCSSLVQSVMTDKVEEHEGLTKNHPSEGKAGFLLPWQLEFLCSEFFNVKCRNRFWQPGWPSHVCVHYAAKVVPFFSPFSMYLTLACLAYI